MSSGTDTVVLVGKQKPTALFTWDFWVGPDQRENHPLSPLSKLSGGAVSAYAYCALFEEGERAYEAGDWAHSTSKLFECQRILKEDHVCSSLISVMSRFNFNSPPDWPGSRQLTEK